MNNPFDYTPDRACDEAFSDLLSRIETLRQSSDPADINLCRELENGKMLGVLVAVDSRGERHALYAFSGQLGDSGFRHPEFVAPVFDYLRPDGYFKLKEREISLSNEEIARFENETLARAEIEYLRANEESDNEIARYREKCRLSKLARDAKRASGQPDSAELAAMTRESQFEKAELRRLKARVASRLEPLARALQDARTRLEEMKRRRHAESKALQKWLFDNFLLLNARGESRSLSDIFADTPLKVPPTGAGECCAPKLLQAAYLRGWHPVAMAEYWYGRPKGGEVRVHGKFYPACRGKCLPVLGWMLQGLEVEPPLDADRDAAKNFEPAIICENEWFVVVDKPSGMLSVPGKSRAISVQQWLEGRYGADRGVKVAHRLDRDTSGLLIATFGPQSYKAMQSLFARRGVRKTYVADLDGDYESRGLPRTGRIELPLSADWLDRPRQRVDREAGKEAATDYEFIGVKEGRSRVMFFPRTGRTHQLRVHAASQEGLGIPIAGDPLYGRHAAPATDRLHLHAHKIEFTFPADGRTYAFTSPLPF